MNDRLDNFISDHIKKSLIVKEKMMNDVDFMSILNQVCSRAIEVYKNKKKILIAGNGGSAADAQHIAGELVSRFYFDRPALPALALTTDTSILTAIGNDYGYEHIFSRQIEANGEKGDMFIAISTSGNSPNILRALKTCREKEMYTVGLTGESGEKMASLCDSCLHVPATETARIQEGHILLGHIICAAVEVGLFGSRGF